MDEKKNDESFLHGSAILKEWSIISLIQGVTGKEVWMLGKQGEWYMVGINDKGL